MILKPCPFCGKKVELVQRLNWLYDIGCSNLECFAWKCIDPKCSDCEDGFVKKEDLIEAWNRRV